MMNFRSRSLQASKFFLPVFFFGLLYGVTPAAASTTSGIIDPLSLGYHTIRLLNDPGFGAAAMSINFGRFANQSNFGSNITVSDSGLRGFAWGAGTGWIVMNCADTASGCTTQNGSFKVAIDKDGNLSGYAWGENTGWINFGPFTNQSISRIKIDYNGSFVGTLAPGAGYAWSEQFGWIVFDCTTTTSCVTTDYRPQSYRPMVAAGGGGNTQIIPAVNISPTIVAATPPPSPAPVQITPPAPSVATLPRVVKKPRRRAAPVSAGVNLNLTTPVAPRAPAVDLITAGIPSTSWDTTPAPTAPVINRSAVYPAATSGEHRVMVPQKTYSTFFDMVQSGATTVQSTIGGFFEGIRTATEGLITTVLSLFGR